MDAALNEGLHLWIDSAIMASKQNSDFIKIDGVTHKFQTDTGNLPVLDDLNLSVPRIALPLSWVLLGCGKSTVTRLVAGLLRPNIGDVWLKGELKLLPQGILLVWLSRIRFCWNGGAY